MVHQSPRVCIECVLS